MSTVVDESVHVKQHPDDFIGVSGMGKGSAGMLGKWAKIIVKISQTKCLLYSRRSLRRASPLSRHQIK